MSTPAQLAANLENSTRSTGPQTESGKGRVSENAITHGLTSTRVILPNEDPAEWESFVAAIVERYSPGTPDEHTLALGIANTEWRLLRAWRAHDHIIGMVTLSLSEQTAGPVDPAAALADQFIRIPDQRRISLNLRYIRAHERAHQAAIAAFTRAKRDRLQAEQQAAEEKAAQAAPAAQPVAIPKPAAEAAAPQPQPPAPAPQLTRAERRLLERAVRKASQKATRGAH